MFLMILDREGRNKAKHLVSDEKISGYSAGGPRAFSQGMHPRPPAVGHGPQLSGSGVARFLILPVHSAGSTHQAWVLAKLSSRFHYPGPAGL